MNFDYFVIFAKIRYAWIFFKYNFLSTIKMLGQKKISKNFPFETWSFFGEKMGYFLILNNFKEENMKTSISRVDLEMIEFL